jgi:flagellar hook-length control protein FliK
VDSADEPASGEPVIPVGKPANRPGESSTSYRAAPSTAPPFGAATGRDKPSAAAGPAVASPAGAHRSPYATNAPLTQGAPRAVAAGESAGGGGSATGVVAEATSSGQAPSTSAGASQTQAPTYGVDLQQTIETTRAAIQFAARQGLSQARISLQPAELGEISIHLSQTAAGLMARLTAETPAAAQALAAGHVELRQSLSSIGISLAHLDIGHLDQSPGTTAGGGGQAGTDSRHPGGQAPTGARGTHRGAGAEGSEGPEARLRAEELMPRAPTLSGARLVDVLV